MPRSGSVVTLFQFVGGLCTLLGVSVAIKAIFAQDYTLKDLIILIVLVALSIILGGPITLTCVKLLGLVLHRLSFSEDQKWVVAFGTAAICDVLLVPKNMLPMTIFSFLSSIMICVVAVGWDCDRSGMTEGFLVGFGKLLLVYLIKQDFTFSLLCGSVLCLAVVAKFTEGKAEATPNPNLAGKADSPHLITQA
uniref:Pollen S n=1 Tax=Papaver rhoeas TaxID=33128 RepID=B3CJF9_PAPRH|nr:papaver rhoeas pollen S [Papaver rhoeas]